MKRRRLGVTLLDSICGLFLISLGLSFYLQTTQMINHRLMISRAHLLEARQQYERVRSDEYKK